MNYLKIDNTFVPFHRTRKWTLVLVARRPQAYTRWTDHMLHMRGGIAETPARCLPPLSGCSPPTKKAKNSRKQHFWLVTS